MKSQNLFSDKLLIARNSVGLEQYRIMTLNGDYEISKGGGKDELFFISPYFIEIQSRP